jgi:hypothetical protein
VRIVVKKSAKFWDCFGLPDPGRCLLLLVTAAALLLPPSPIAWGDSRPKKNVLILFPSQSDNPAQFHVVKGIKSVIDASSEFRTEYFIEYMDLPRNTSEAYQRKLLELYSQKYQDSRLDLIIPFSGPALDFVVRNRNEIFPSVPIVFSGVLNEELTLMTLPADCTGILGVIDFAGQLDLILSIHPRTRRIAVISGASSIDLTIEKQFRQAFEPYRDRLRKSWNESAISRQTPSCSSTSSWWTARARVICRWKSPPKRPPRPMSRSTAPLIRIWVEASSADGCSVLKCWASRRVRSVGGSLKGPSPKICRFRIKARISICSTGAS